MLLVVLVNTETADVEDHLVLVRVETSTGEVMSRAALMVKSPLAVGASFQVAVPFRVEGPAHDETRWLELAFDTEDQFLTRFPLHFAVDRAAT